MFDCTSIICSKQRACVRNEHFQYTSFSGKLHALIAEGLKPSGGCLQLAVQKTVTDINNP